MKKNILCIVLILLLCYSVPAFADDSGIKIFINGDELNTPVNPVNENGTTLVPMKSIFEALGLAIEWDGETQTVTGTNNKVAIKLTIGNKIAYVNGVEKELLIAPKIVNGSTIVPLRFISEATGCEVNWNGETESIEICSKINNGQLYTIPGDGTYKEYIMLKGYEGEDKFQVYFQGNADSFTTTIEDLRGIDLDKTITWKYNENYYKSSIKELYGLFSDSLRIKNLLGISPGEELSDEWFISTFGKVYLDWVDGIGYSNDASNLVTEYFKQTGQINLDRNSLLTPDTTVEPDKSNDEELKKKDEELQKRINDILESGGTTSH